MFPGLQGLPPPKALSCAPEPLPVGPERTSQLPLNLDQPKHTTRGVNRLPSLAGPPSHCRPGVLLPRPSSTPENRRGKELGCKRFQCENSKCILLLIKRRPCLSRNNVKIKFQKLNAQHTSLPTPSQHFRWLCPRSLHGTSKNKRVAKAAVSLIGLISSLQVLSTNLMLYPPSSLSRHAALCECTSSFSD